VKIMWHIDGTVPKKVWLPKFSYSHASGAVARLRLGCGALGSEPNTPIVSSTMHVASGCIVNLKSITSYSILQTPDRLSDLGLLQRVWRRGR
jgi:hypothetical protein